MRVVPASSVKASIHNPELGVTCPPPHHTAQNYACYPHGEQLTLATPKSGKGKHNPKRDQQYGKADEGVLDKDFSHHCGAT